MNIQPYIVLNNKDSRQIKGLLVSALAPISKPQVRTQVETVDGRDGDIVTPLGFSAYDKVITIGLTYGYNVDDIIEYFNSSGAVVFSNEPDKIYQYAIYEQIDFERLIRFKKAEVTFHVQPFKRSSSEFEKTFTVEADQVIKVRNNGNIYSRPKLTITGSGDVNLYINGVQILTIALGESSQTIIIDAEQMNAYNSSNVLLNRLVTGNYDNIKFNIGYNSISFVGGTVTQLKVDNYSRWI